MRSRSDSTAVVALLGVFIWSGCSPASPPAPSPSAAPSLAGATVPAASPSATELATATTTPAGTVEVPGATLDAEAVPAPEVVSALASESATTATVSYAEATVLEATAPGGATLTLTIPPGALLPGIEVRMTPIESLSGLPDGFELVGGAMFEPEGMWLARPAILEIDTPTTGQETDTVPLVLDGSATAGEAYLGRAETSTGVVVDHFSGAVRVTPGSENPLNWTPSSSVARAAHALHRLGELTSHSGGASLVVTYWRSMHQVNIVPLLSEAAALASLHEMDTTDALNLAAILTVVLAWAEFPPNDQWTQADRDLAELVKQQLFEALRVAVAFILDVCNEQHDLEALAFLLIWQGALAPFGASLPADAAALSSCLSFEFRLNSTLEGRDADFIRLGLRGAVPMTVGLNPPSDSTGFSYAFNPAAGPLRYVEAVSSTFPAIGPCGESGEVTGGNGTVMTVPFWYLTSSFRGSIKLGTAEVSSSAIVTYELGSPTENVRMCGGTYEFEPGLFQQWYSELHEASDTGTITEEGWQSGAAGDPVVGRVNYQRSDIVSFVLKATYPGDEGDGVSATVDEHSVLELVHGTQ